MLYTIPHNFTPRPYQLDAWKAFDNGKRKVFIRWARRSGKDKFSFNMMVKEAVFTVGNYFYVFPSYAQGRKAVWEAIQQGERLLDHIPREIRHDNNNEMKITLLNKKDQDGKPLPGSIIRIVGSDNIDNLVGSNPQGIVFSEYSLQNPQAWEYLSPIIAQNKGWVIFNGTPRGKNHMYDLEVIARKHPDIWHVSVIQNLDPALPDYFPTEGTVEATISMIEEERKHLSPETIASEYGCSYTGSVDGAYYTDEIRKAETEGRIGEYPHNYNNYTDTFFDLGKSDETAIWFAQRNGSALIFTDFFTDRNKGLQHYVDILKAKGYKYRFHWLPHDGEHPQWGAALVSTKTMLQTLLRDAGVDGIVVCASKCHRKVDAIQAVRQRFPRYYFNMTTCADGILRLSQYHKTYDKNRRIFLDTPERNFATHAADALTTEALSARTSDDFANGAIKQYKSYKSDFNPFFRGSK
jgi:phage terminase large subunit